MISTYMQAIELLINGIWIAFPVTELLTFVVAVILF